MSTTFAPARPGAYAPASRWLHWVVAALVVVMVVLGMWITAFEPADEAFKLRLYDIHESTGVTIWALMLVRLLVRQMDPPRSLPASVPRGMRRAGQANHVAMYLLLLTLPIVGFLATNAWGFPVRWFGLFQIASPVGKDEALAKLLSGWHAAGAFALVVLVLLHVAAASYHGLVRRDGVLQRMTGAA